MSSVLPEREYWFGLQWVDARDGMRRTQNRRMKRSYWTCLMGVKGGLREQARKQTERQIEELQQVQEKTDEDVAGQRAGQTAGRTAGRTAGQAMAWVPSCWLNSRRTQSVLRLAQNGPSRARLTRVQAYSAAACMAAHHPQDAVFLLWTVAPGRLWFLVLEHGQVMEGSDCLLA